MLTEQELATVREFKEQKTTILIELYITEQLRWANEFNKNKDKDNLSKMGMYRATGELKGALEVYTRILSNAFNTELDYTYDYDDDMIIKRILFYSLQNGETYNIIEP